MAFQAADTVYRFQTPGWVGDRAKAGPEMAQTKILESGDADNNVFGRAFTQVAGAANSDKVAAGGTGVFAGIMWLPKEHVTSGSGGNALAPAYTLRNGEVASFVSMTSGVWVDVGAAASIGDEIHFVQATGALKAKSPGTAPIVGETLIEGATVTYVNTEAPTTICMIEMLGSKQTTQGA